MYIAIFHIIGCCLFRSPAVDAADTSSSKSSIRPLRESIINAKVCGAMSFKQ